MNQLPDSPAGLMHLLPSTSSQITTFANGIVQAVRRGDENALDVMLQIRAMEKALKIILENVKPYADREAEKYAETTINFKGNEIVKCEIKTEYDYAACNDPVYQLKLYEFEKAQKELKEREAFLKAVKEPMTIVDDQTGEVVEVRPPLKKSTSGLKIMIK